MSLVRINWHPNRLERQKFGVAMAVGFTLIALVLLYKRHSLAALYAFLFGMIAAALGLSGTWAVMPIYWVWMGLAYVMGSLMSRVLLVLTFYGLFWPLGALGRLCGRDKLGLRRRENGSYWVDLPPPAEKERYERQF